MRDPGGPARGLPRLGCALQSRRRAPGRRSPARAVPSRQRRGRPQHLRGRRGARHRADLSPARWQSTAFRRARSTRARRRAVQRLRPDQARGRGDLPRAGPSGSPQRSLAIVRPTVVFGPGNRGNVYVLLEQIASGRSVMIGNGTQQQIDGLRRQRRRFPGPRPQLGPGVHVYNYVDKPDVDMTSCWPSPTRRSVAAAPCGFPTRWAWRPAWPSISRPADRPSVSDQRRAGQEVREQHAVRREPCARVRISAALLPSRSAGRHDPPRVRGRTAAGDAVAGDPEALD